LSYISDCKSLTKKLRVNRLKKSTQLVVLLFILPLLVFGQQEEHYSMYMLNKHGINPGYAGLENSLHGTAVYRQQWNGLADAPQQTNVNMHLPMYIIGGGVGINLKSDSRGATQDLGASLTYSYHLQVNAQNLLGIGISAGLSQRSLDGNKLRAPEGNYTNTIAHNDPLLPETKVSGMGSKIDVGLFWQNAKFGVGLGVHNLVPSTYSLDLNEGSLVMEQVTHFTAMIESSFEVGSLFSIRPSILARSDLKQHELHFSAQVYYDNFIMLGTSFRGYSASTTDAIAIMAGFQINDKVFLSYSYDLTLSDLALVSRGSHEIMLNYNLGKPIGKGKLPKIIFNPRF